MLQSWNQQGNLQNVSRKGMNAGEIISTAFSNDAEE